MKFVRESYIENDKWGKDKLISFLQGEGYQILNSEEDMNHDVIATKDERVEYFEVEVKKGYPFTSRGDYPFNTVSFLARKKRLHEVKPFWYIIISRETEHALVAHSSDVFSVEQKQNLFINKGRRKGEDSFYRIPKIKCKFFKL